MEVNIERKSMIDDNNEVSEEVTVEGDIEEIERFLENYQFDPLGAILDTADTAEKDCEEFEKDCDCQKNQDSILNATSKLEFVVEPLVTISNKELEDAIERIVNVAELSEKKYSQSLYTVAETLGRARDLLDRNLI